MTRAKPARRRRALGFRPVRTERLELRPLAADDYDAWREAQLAQGPPRDAFDRGRRPPRQLTRAAFARRLDREARLRDADAHYVLQVFERATGAHLGTVDFLVFARLVIQCANLGYAVHNHRWGEGIATEAVRAAIPAAFARLALHRLEASTEPEHAASIAVMEKAGLVREGVRRKYLFVGNAWRDMVFYSAVADEWGVAGAAILPRVRVELEG